MAKAALEAMNGLNLFGEQGCPHSTIHVDPDAQYRNRLILNTLLPRESSSKVIIVNLIRGREPRGAGGLEPPHFLNRGAEPPQNWRVSMGQMYMIANVLCRMYSGQCVFKINYPLHEHRAPPPPSHTFYMLSLPLLIMLISTPLKWYTLQCYLQNTVTNCLP